MIGTSLRRLTQAGAIATLVGLFALAPGAAAGGAEGDLSQNAALRDWRVWTTWQTPELSDAVKETPTEVGDPAFTLPETVQRTLALPASQEYMTHLLRAAAIADCDFGIDRDLGVAMLLPHLAKARHSAILLAADARLHLDGGDAGAAAARIAAGYRMAEHMSRDRVLISSLVGVAIFSITDKVAIYADERALLDDDPQRVIREALATIDPADPFGVRACIAGEREMIRITLGEMLAQPDAHQRIANLSGLFGGGEPLSRELREAIANERAHQSYLDLFDAYFVHILEAWDKPDAVERILRIESRIKQGAYGPFAPCLAASFGRVANQQAKVKDMLTTALDRVAQ